MSGEKINIIPTRAEQDRLVDAAVGNAKIADREDPDSNLYDRITGMHLRRDFAGQSHGFGEDRAHLEVLKSPNESAVEGKLREERGKGIVYLKTERTKDSKGNEKTYTKLNRYNNDGSTRELTSDNPLVQKLAEMAIAGRVANTSQEVIERAKEQKAA